MTTTTRPRTTAEILTSSESTDWWTPDPYISACREMLGTKDDLMGIDLDPASCLRANTELVRAKQFYEPPQNGLELPWFGKVFLNPPYSKTRGVSNQLLWTQKLFREFAAGNVTEAILLTNVSTSTKWFAPLWEHSSCWVDHRINFVRPEGGKSSSTHDNVFFYLGKRTPRFAQFFVQFGPVVLPHGVYRRK